MEKWFGRIVDACVLGIGVSVFLVCLVEWLR